MMTKAMMIEAMMTTFGGGHVGDVEVHYKMTDWQRRLCKCS